MEKMT